MGLPAFLQNEGSDDLLTVEESAKLLRVSPTTIWRLVQSGQLPAIRVGRKALRIRKSDLQAMVRPATEESERRVART